MNKYSCLFGAVLAGSVAIAAPAWAAEPLPAFPGAEGFGSTTIGGRGGKVIEVTNLNDKGPGSFREAVTTDTSRTIVFRVSGTIALESDLEVTKPFCTIAGQTAPGDGICLRNYKLGVKGTHDVVVRYIRIRRGRDHGKDDGLGVYEDAATKTWAENVIIDHCTASWTFDEVINTWHHTRNVTYQWCMISEALGAGHGFAATLGGENTTYHHNLIANNVGRNPSIGGNASFRTINLDFRNNVIFNWGHRTMDGKPFSINVVNNYWKPGPMTTLKDRIVRMDKINADVQGHWYVSGNFYLGNDEINKDNKKAIEGDEGLKPEEWLLSKPLEVAPVKTQKAQDAYDSVLPEAGATLPKRDSVDTRIAEEVKTGKPKFGNGLLEDPATVGGWPEYKSTQSSADTDHDGMPDWWEKKVGLNPADPADGAKDLNGDGYTNLEKYLNGLDPTKKIDWNNPENNKNTLTPTSLVDPDKK